MGILLGVLGWIVGANVGGGVTKAVGANDALQLAAAIGGGVAGVILMRRLR